jgi:hypothetical protein
MRMSRTRTRGAVRRNVCAVQPLEPRLCLASVVYDVDFLAGNYSFDDPAFQFQPASNVNMRAVEVAVPDDMVQTVPPIYLPSGLGVGSFGWDRPRTMTRPKPDSPVTVQATASSSVRVTGQMATVPAGMSTEDYLNQVASTYTNLGYTRTAGPTDSLEPWVISGGQFNGEHPLMKTLVAFYAKTTGNATLDYHQEATAEVFPAGHAPNGQAVYYSVVVTVESKVSTSDPTVISLAEASAELLKAATPAARDAEVSATVFPSLQFAGAIPETLFLYDFEGLSTVPPADVKYVDQYDQATLPVWRGAPGGNASGPSSVAMAIDEDAEQPAVEAVYDHTMRRGLNVPPETPQGFDWTRAERSVQGYLGDTATVVTRHKDTWDRIERNVRSGSRVVLRTNLGQDVNPGAAHEIVLLGWGHDPDVKQAVRALYPSDATGDYYIVADPGGNYFADASHGGLDVGHYGRVNALRSLSKGITYGGRFAVYPVAQLKGAVGPSITTLTIRPADSTAQVKVHSPVAVVVTDPLGRRTGVGTDGSVLEEIPESEYQVAVAEEEGTGVTTLDPEEEKGVVMSNPVPGVYQVDLVGTGTGPYTLDASTSLPGQPRTVTTYSGTATPGATAHYTFTVAGARTPQLKQVFADSTAWSPSFRQFMQASGAGDAAMGYRVNGGDTLPWVNVDRLVLSYDRDIPPIPVAAFYVVHGARRDYEARLTFLDSRSFLLSFDRPLAETGDRFHLTDPFFGSGFDLRFNALPGDTDASGVVLAADYSGVKRKFFSSTANPGTGDAAYSVFHDVDGSGSILANDYSAVKSRFFNTLPSGEPTQAAAATAVLDGARLQPLQRPRLIDDLAP